MKVALVSVTSIYRYVEQPTFSNESILDRTGIHFTTGGGKRDRYLPSDKYALVLRRQSSYLNVNVSLITSL